MFSIIKFGISFSVSFLILSVPLQNRTVFDWASDFAEPMVSKIFGTIKDKTSESFEQGKKAASGLFKIPETKIRITHDLHKKESGSQSEKIEEYYTEEERALLERVLKKAHP